MLITLNNSQPLHRQIYEKLRGQVLSGNLKADQKLPTTRELAHNLSVSRTTVLQAYDQLIAEGYIYTRAGSGTYANKLLKAAKPATPGKNSKNARFVLSSSARELNTCDGSLATIPPAQNGIALRYDFSMGKVRMDSHSSQIWRKLVNQCLKDPDASPHESQGYYPLRQVIAEQLQRVRNCHCRAENIVITHGAQQAFDVLGRLLLNPGDTAAMENPGYFGVKKVLAACRAKCIYVDIDQQGIIIEQLEKQAANAKLVYVTPSHQFPTGCIMSLTRRMALIEWAKANNAYIIEDDYDSEFHYDGRPVEAIQAIDPYGHTIYVGTFSKVLSPALRLGYVVLPDSMVSAFVAMQWVAGMQSTPLQQQALARWMTGGYHHRHLHRMHKIYAERHNNLLHSLKKYFSKGDIYSERSNTGLHILLWLNRVPVERGIACLKKLQERGITVYPAAGFYHSPPPKCGFGMGFGLIAIEDIEPAIRLFYQTVAEFC